MTPRYGHEAVDRSLQDVTGVASLFGGKLIIIGGDFRQLLPVVRNSNKSETINASITSSPLLVQLQILRLSVNMRVNHDEQNFVRWLQALGEGKLSFEGDFTKTQIPEGCKI